VLGYKREKNNLPLYELLGGNITDGAPLYRCVMEQEHDKIKVVIEQYRISGYKYFKLRVGINPHRDIELIKFAADLIEPREFLYLMQIAVGLYWKR